MASIAPDPPLFLATRTEWVIVRRPLALELAWPHRASEQGPLRRSAGLEPSVLPVVTRVDSMGLQKSGLLPTSPVPVFLADDEPVLGGLDLLADVGALTEPSWHRGGGFRPGSSWMFGFHDPDRGMWSLAPFKAGGLSVDTTP